MKMNRSLLFVGLLFISALLAPTAHAASLDIWWPTNGSHISGKQPLKAVVSGRDVDSYSLYWQVDNGQQNYVPTSHNGYPHKETTIDFTNWNWHADGHYPLTLTAKDSGGHAIVTQKITVYLPVSSDAKTKTAETPTQNQQSEPAPVTTQTAPTQPTPAPVQESPAPVVSASASSFYVNPHSAAASQAQAWSSSRPSDAAKMQTLAHMPTATWFGGWNRNVQNDVSNVVKAATAQNQTAVLVAYNIPNRDCGSYSAGGTNDYINWISSFAKGIGSGNALVILEPDAVAQSSCLSGSAQSARYSLLSRAVQILKSNPHTSVYLDAGHSGWVNPSTMAARLKQAGIASADGFSLNVSNFDATDAEESYGESLSKTLGGTHFVIDTSRNGNGSNGQWCNPSGRAIGQAPTTQTGNPLVDAFLWVKTPGESDGTCNGGPSAGKWWADYALSLVNNKR